MPFDQLKRREFITLLGGADVAARGARAASGRNTTDCRSHGHRDN